MTPTKALLLVAAGLAACDQRNLADHPLHPPLLAVESVRTVALDAVLPSDALLLDDGSTLVLDGYAGRVLRVDGATGAVTPFSTEPVGRASRLSPAADGGVWVTRPGDELDPGSLLHLDASGAPLGVQVPRDADGAPMNPVDVLDRGGQLVVADRHRGLVWLGPDGVVARTVTAGFDGAELRRVVDLVPLADGFAAVDTLTPALSTWSGAGVPSRSFGRSGLSVGTLARPTSVAVAPGGWLVADSVLGVIQAFEEDGDLIGALADSGAVARFGHPVAVRTHPAAPGVVVVLEASPAQLRILRSGALPAAGPKALLRETLVEADPDPAGEKGGSCSQCHDGLVLDSRQLWDPARKHHPVDVVPERPLPAFFPLDEGGRLTCRSCHSPHGVVEEADDDAAPLVRHASSDSPFMRLDRRADALCTACHDTDVHDVEAVGAGAPTGGGHLAGPALVAALKERGGSAEELGKASCLSCHTNHGAVADPLLRSADEASACVACHAPQQDSAHNHPLGRVPGRDLVRATADGPVRLAADGGVGCLSCHDLTASTTALLRRVEGGSPVCTECHTQRGDLAQGSHRKLAEHGAPACVACHDVHGGDPTAHFVASGPVSEGDPRGCLSCHGGPGKAAAPGRLGHPVTGAALALAVEGSDRLDCLACHDPHAADRPKSSDCEACHADQADARTAGGHGDATCLDCHPAHNAAPGWSGGDNPASARCLACHAEGRATSGAPVVADYEHPAPQFLPDGSRWKPLSGLVLFDAGGAPVPAGQNGDLTCQSCHVVHGPDGKADHLRRATGWQEACAACHGDDGLVFYRTFHDPAERAELTGRTP